MKLNLPDLEWFLNYYEKIARVIGVCLICRESSPQVPQGSRDSESAPLASKLAISIPRQLPRYGVYRTLILRPTLARFSDWHFYLRHRILIYSCHKCIMLKLHIEVLQSSCLNNSQRANPPVELTNAAHEFDRSLWDYSEWVLHFRFC